MKEVIPLEKIKGFFRGLANLFKNMSDIVEYSETQKNTDASLTKLNKSLDAINKTMENMGRKLDIVSEQTKGLEDDMKKVKSGLQKELFNSLQTLHDKYCPGTGRGWATYQEKMEAKMFYDEIHIMGQNGWSTKTFEDIFNLPETEKEMFMRVNLRK